MTASVIPTATAPASLGERRPGLSQSTARAVRLGPRDALETTPRRGAPSFGDLLRQAGAPTSSGEPDTLRDAASKLVASAFILPTLESIRESPFADGPLAPGTAERRFMPLLDQHMADRVAAAAGFSLVDVIVDRLSRGEATPIPGAGAIA